MVISYTYNKALWIGYIYLISVGGILGIVSIIFLHLGVLNKYLLSIPIILFTFILLYLCIKTLSILRKNKAASQINQLEYRKKARKYGQVLLSVIAISILVNIILIKENSYRYIPVEYYFFMGFHFIPLAIIFKFKSYYILGILTSLSSVIALIFAYNNTVVYGASVSILIPVTGFILGIWITVINTLREYSLSNSADFVIEEINSNRTG